MEMFLAFLGDSDHLVKKGSGTIVKVYNKNNNKHFLSKYIWKILTKEGDVDHAVTDSLVLDAFL